MIGGLYSELEAFEAILQHGSFTAAARQLQVTPGAITRRLNTLEARLGAKLLNRSTRRLSLTESGRHYYAEVAPALAQILAAGERVHDLSAQPRGELRVSVPMNFGRLYVIPHLPAFLDRYPGISLDVQFDDRFVDLIGAGFDAAIRIGALSDSRLVARRIAETRRILVASPDYLHRRGAPAAPAELIDHDCLHYTLFRDTPTWEFQRDREPLRVPVRGRLKANYGVPLVDAAVRGGGILQTATFAVAHELASGELVEVMPDWSLLPIGIYAVYPGREYRPRKVEAFIDFLEETIGRPAVWDRVIAGDEVSRGG
ncbi:MULTISPECIES: LysR family transcriptional regulator [unclassified Lysobacter]|uniref:LysR family transcriptional regulator n=1 Tax=unclassified Lysobacter TaxID=2635362 RepID=UPI001BEA4091|nr:MULTISPECIES: LysR family transcriptional regulator [unclassified Lysobacter]MBT2746312.1 LysR family transcriptional regulator [Lysobacter sp. ISL-42]MBT2751215.1 LysR family transcriptional regulator [Lysobacter sp. ISL-50]MBT2775623.1 LysR family transcriptional regulator [Lysobacter sp. ISL-54]MBT2780008.1 LysR family transcriptional regulator [Lysobacter sp. ISL-52]